MRWWRIALCLGLGGLLSCTCDPPDVKNNSGVLATDLKGDRLLFEDTRFNEKIRKKFLLYNDGSAPVEIAGIAVTGEQKRFFRILSLPAFPALLPPGKAAGIGLEIEFTSQASTGIVARLQIQAKQAQNTNEEGRFYVELSNQLKLSKLAFSCDPALDFGKVARGKSKLLPCTIENRGSGDVQLQSARYKAETGGEEFHWVEGSFPKRLRPQERWKVLIRYQPKDYETTEDRGHFEIKSDLQLAKGQRPPVLEVRGVTEASVIQLSAHYGRCENHEECQMRSLHLRCAKDQGDSQTCRSTPHRKELIFLHLQGHSTATHYATIASTGTQPLKVAKLELKAAPQHFSAVFPKLPFTLEPGKSVRIPIKHTAGPGVVAPGRLWVTSDAHNAPKTSLELLSLPLACRLWLLSPKLTLDGLDFGTPKAGETTSLSLTIDNRGGGKCRIKELRISSKNPAHRHVFKIDLHAHQSIPYNLKNLSYLSFLIEFTPPLADTEYRATLEVLSDDPTRPSIEIPLVGKTKKPEHCLHIDPGALDFGLASLDCPVKRVLKLHLPDASGCASVTIDSYSIEGSSSFALDAKAPSFPLTFAPNDAVTLPLRMHQRSRTSTEKATLTLKFSQPKQLEVSIPLVGQVVDGIQRRDTYTHRDKKSSYPLSLPPIPESIRVEITPLFNGNHGYNAKDNAITFDPGELPPPGSTIHIDYLVACAEPPP